MAARDPHKLFRSRLPLWLGLAVLGLLALGLFGLVPGLTSATFGARDDARTLVPEQFDVLVTGEEFHWEVRYPGPDGEIGTDDDRLGSRDVHVPAGTNVRIHLRSRDYVYTFALPELDLKQIAVPDMEFSLAFRAPPAGVSPLLGDQMCGYDHPDLIGDLVVAEHAAFTRTMDARPSSRAQR